jgi:hypothetical protein
MSLKKLKKQLPWIAHNDVGWAKNNFQPPVDPGM